MYRTAELLRECVPGQSAFLASRIQRLGEGSEIPPEALVGTSNWEHDSVVRSSRRDEKALRSAVQPSENEECVLAGAIAALRNTGQCRCADRVIPTGGVERVGLLPEFGGHLSPTEPPLRALRVHRRVQTRCAEFTQRVHSDVESKRRIKWSGWMSSGDLEDSHKIPLEDNRIARWFSGADIRIRTKQIRRVA